MTIAALLIANSPWGQAFLHFWEKPVGISFDTWLLERSRRDWINDGLMALFFLLVGLELKREFLVGELSSFQNAVLPVIAAAGGMIIPALIYHMLNQEGLIAIGWGIPMATDIAFAVGILVLLAWRIPRNLVIFLMAIANDLGAALVISLFYTNNINIILLQMTGSFILILLLLNRSGIRHAFLFALTGIFCG